MHGKSVSNYTPLSHEHVCIAGALSPPLILPNQHLMLEDSWHNIHNKMVFDSGADVSGRGALVALGRPDCRGYVEEKGREGKNIKLHRPRSFLTGAVLTFREEEDPRRLEGRIVECTWDGEAGAWIFLRERTDKNAPNAYHVYEKVMQSIDDNITEDDLLGAVDEAVKLPPYQRDAQQAAVAKGGAR